MKNQKTKNEKAKRKIGVKLKAINKKPHLHFFYL